MVSWRTVGDVRKIYIPNIFGINLVESEYNKEHIPSGTSSSPYGKFGEFSIPVQNLDEMESKLLNLGFETTLKESKPYPWGIFRDGLITLGVHQTDDFDIPTITYFDEEMEFKLEQLSKKGIEFQKFAGMELNTGNVKIVSPDGQEFLFLKGKI